MAHAKFFTHSNIKSTSLLISLTALLTACGGGGGGSDSTATPTPTATTTPAPVVLPTAPITTDITPTTTTPVTPTLPTSNAISQAILDTLNAKRSQCGFGSLTYNSELEKAATNHVNYLGYISTQNKTPYGSHTEGTVGGLIGTGTDNPYYTGYSVSNRIITDATQGLKAQPVSYQAAMAAENLSLATLTTVNTVVDASIASQTMLNSLLAAPYHMRGLVSPSLTQMGVNYTQVEWQNTQNKDIMSMLEMVSALPKGQMPAVVKDVLSYPCDGVTGTEYALTDEAPNPMGTRNLQQNPVGQPTYILAPTDKAITGINARLVSAQGVASDLTILTQDTDPNKQLKANEAFIIPNLPLQPATTYTLQYTLTYSNGEQAIKQFNFTTKA